MIIRIALIIGVMLQLLVAGVDGALLQKLMKARRSKALSRDHPDAKTACEYCTGKVGCSQCFVGMFTFSDSLTFLIDLLPILAAAQHDSFFTHTFTTYTIRQVFLHDVACVVRRAEYVH